MDREEKPALTTEAKALLGTKVSTLYLLAIGLAPEDDAERAEFMKTCREIAGAAVDAALEIGVDCYERIALLAYISVAAGLTAVHAISADSLLKQIREADGVDDLFKNGGENE